MTDTFLRLMFVDLFHVLPAKGSFVGLLDHTIFAAKTGFVI